MNICGAKFQEQCFSISKIIKTALRHVLLVYLYSNFAIVQRYNNHSSKCIFICMSVGQFLGISKQFKSFGGVLFYKQWNLQAIWKLKSLVSNLNLLKNFPIEIYLQEFLSKRRTLTISFMTDYDTVFKWNQTWFWLYQLSWKCKLVTVTS